MPGRHNVLNAAAAFALATEEGLPRETVLRALDHFQGVGRRFNVYQSISFGSKTCTVVDDYGHHPSEVQATLLAAREAWPESRVVMVFQPHRYSRTRDLYEDFVSCLAGTDVLLLLEVYSAGEPEILGADSRSLARSIRQLAGVDPIFIEDEAALIRALPAVVDDGDIVIFQGAGDIGKLSNRATNGEIKWQSK